MLEMNINALRLANEVGSDPDIDKHLQRALLDLDGGTIEDGIAIANTVQKKAHVGEQVDPILLEAQYIRPREIGLVGESGNVVVAKNVPLNIGLVFGFELANDEREAAEVLKKVNDRAGILHLGKSGLRAITEVVSCEDDLTDCEIRRLTRSAGFRVIPQMPSLRASLM